MEDCSIGQSAVVWVRKPNFGSFCCGQPFVGQSLIVQWPARIVHFNYCAWLWNWSIMLSTPFKGNLCLCYCKDFHQQFSDQVSPVVQFPSPQLTADTYMREVVLTDTAYTIYCTYHTVLQSTHYAIWDAITHCANVLCQIQKTTKYSTVHVVKSGKVFPKVFLRYSPGTHFSFPFIQR